MHVIYVSLSLSSMRVYARRTRCAKHSANSDNPSAATSNRAWSNQRGLLGPPVKATSPPAALIQFQNERYQADQVLAATAVWLTVSLFITFLTCYIGNETEEFSF